MTKFEWARPDDPLIGRCSLCHLERKVLTARFNGVMICHECEMAINERLPVDPDEVKSGSMGILDEMRNL